jgi:hypothetical protein
VLPRSALNNGVERGPFRPADAIIVALAIGAATLRSLYDVHAQNGLIVGSGNFFSPIVSDLDKAIAFAKDGIGSTSWARRPTRSRTRRCGTCSACQTRRCGGPLRVAGDANRRRDRRDLEAGGAASIAVRRIRARSRSSSCARHQRRIGEAKQAGASVVMTGGAPITVGRAKRSS